LNYEVPLLEHVDSQYVTYFIVRSKFTVKTIRLHLFTVTHGTRQRCHEKQGDLFNALYCMWT